MAHRPPTPHRARRMWTPSPHLPAVLHPPPQPERSGPRWGAAKPKAKPKASRWRRRCASPPSSPPIWCCSAPPPPDLGPLTRCASPRRRRRRYLRDDGAFEARCRRRGRAEPRFDGGAAPPIVLSNVAFGICARSRLASTWCGADSALTAGSVLGRNMEYRVSSAFNHSAEIAASSYAGLRLATVAKTEPLAQNDTTLRPTAGAWRARPRPPAPRAQQGRSTTRFRPRATFLAANCTGSWSGVAIGLISSVGWAQKHHG